MKADKKVWDWRAYIINYGPDKPTYKHVLLTLSCFMDSSGGSCFPSIKKLCQCSSLGKTTVIKYLNEAEKDGWIKKDIHGFSGQGWRRNEYTATLPEKIVRQMNNVKKGSLSDGKGGSFNKQDGSIKKEKVVHEVNTTSPDNSPNTSSNNTPNNNRTSEEAETIYYAYPRKVGKGKAIKEIKAALKRLSVRESIEDPDKWLLDKVKKFAESPKGNEGKYTPYPATWFKEERYDDDPVEWNSYEESFSHLFTYDEMVDKITSGQFKNEDFQIRKDKSDGQGQYLWELL